MLAPDPEARASRLRDQFIDGWDDDRAGRVAAAMARRAERRQRQRRWARGAGAALVICIGLWLARGRAPGPGQGPVRVEAGLLRLRDGSTVQTLAAATSIKIRSEARAEVTVELLAGQARFEVTRDPGRVFRVLAGPVTVQVLGTSFTVARRGDRSEVVVQAGHVQVLWPTGRHDLHGGEGGLFPLAPVGPAPAGELPVPPAGLPAPSGRPPAPSPPAAPPRATSLPIPPVPAAAPPRLAPALGATPARGAAEPTAGPLMDAADAARRQGRFAEAAAHLRQVVRRHPRDPQAPLAAFTLGRLLLDDLDRPGEAGASFARAQALAPQGALAEEALGREVEAWARAGQQDLAAQRARTYLSRHPNGLWAREVRRHVPEP